MVVNLLKFIGTGESSHIWSVKNNQITLSYIVNVVGNVTFLLWAVGVRQIELCRREIWPRFTSKPWSVKQNDPCSVAIKMTSVWHPFSFGSVSSNPRL